MSKRAAADEATQCEQNKRANLDATTASSSDHAEAVERRRVALAALRGEMRSRGVVAYIVPTDDPHQTEHPPHCFARR